MNDVDIIGLFFKRDERALSEVSAKYGAYCFTVAKNILGVPADAEECVSSALLKAWETIPPKRPEKLRLYLARITRSVAFNRFREMNRQKRGGGEAALVLDELAEIVPAEGGAASEAEYRELKAAVNAFLRALPERERRIFVARVFRAEPVKAIARGLGMSEGAVMTSLSRTRKKLRQKLIDEEII